MEIKDLLEKDEKIIWKTERTINYLGISCCNFLCAIFLIILLGVVIYINIIDSFSLISLILILPLGIVIFIVLKMGYGPIRGNKEKYGLTVKDLWKYPEIKVITNQRIIQKAYHNYNFDKSFYAKHQIGVKDNMIFVNWEQINAIIFDFRISAPELSFFLDFEFAYLGEQYDFLTPLIFEVEKQECSNIENVAQDVISPKARYKDKYENKFYLYEDIEIPEKWKSELELKKI